MRSRAKHEIPGGSVSTGLGSASPSAPAANGAAPPPTSPAGSLSVGAITAPLPAINPPAPGGPLNRPERPADLMPIGSGPWDMMPDRVQAARTALWLEAGNLTKAAAHLSTRPSALAAFVASSSYLKAERDAARSLIIDRAEEVILEQLADTQDQARRDDAARFVLQTFGRAAGWGDVKNPAPPQGSVSLNAPGGGQVTVRWGDEVLPSEEG